MIVLPWNRQPPANTPLDTNHALVKRAKIFIDGRNLHRELLSGHQADSAPAWLGIRGKTFRTGPTMGYEIPGTADNRYSEKISFGDLPQADLGSSFTVLYVGRIGPRPGSSNDNRSIFGRYPNSLPNNSWFLGHTGDAGSPIFLYINSSGAACSLGFNPSGYESLMYGYAITQDGTTLRARVSNGTTASTTTNVGTIGASTDKFSIGGRGNNDGQPATFAYCLVIPNYCATDGEIAGFLANPWAVYSPAGLFVKAAGGGGPTPLTATLDAAIQEARSATATLNAVIQTSVSSTATLDGVIQQSRSSTATLDGTIQAAVSATVTLNAAIQAAMSGTSTLDAVIANAGSTSLTTTLNAAIQEAKSLTATLDAVIQTSGSASTTLNAVIVQVNSSTATLDATILAAVTAFALLDAYIFDADAPVVTTTPVAVAGRGRRRRYIMPDDSVVIATPSEAEQLVKLFVKPVPPKKPPKKAVKALKKIELVEIEEVSSDTVPTERITVKKKAVWEQSDLYNQAIKLLAEREILRRRREEEMILLAA